MTPEVAKRVKQIFESCPTLTGFTIQTEDVLPERMRGRTSNSDLIVTDIGIYPYVNSNQCEEIYHTIAASLISLLNESPAVKDELKGKTFARSLH